MIPLKVKKFTWLAIQEVIFTKDDLVKWKWKGDESCAFCTNKETVNHIFFGYSTVGYVWSLIAYALGAICRPSSFAQFWTWIQWVLPNGSPTKIICLMCSFLTYWAGLQKPELDQQVIQGTETVKNIALYFHKTWRPICQTGVRSFLMLESTSCFVSSQSNPDAVLMLESASLFLFFSAYEL